MQHLLRRKIIHIIILMAFPFAGFSQLRESLNLLDFDDKLIHFGINLGVNSSHFNFTHHPYFLNQTNTNDTVLDVESLNNIGINLAWLVNFSISNHLALRTYPLDLTFSQKAFQYNLSNPNRPAGETPITLKTVQSITLSLPVQVEFNSDRIDNFKVYTIAGGQIAYDLAAEAGATNTNGLITLNKFDYGIECGLGFHLYYPFFVLSPELRVDWGLSNLNDRDPNDKYSNTIDKVYSRMLSFSLTIE
jgi:hypothetical protein